MLARSFVESDPPFVPAGTYHDVPVFPHHIDAIPPGVVESGAYDLRFAWTRTDLHAVQTLRYRVFNEELGEGTPAATAARRDEDERDPWFHHLMICHRESGEVVGTYRLQTAVMAATRHGFYSASLFELGAIPAAILDRSIEVGRACVAPGHRSGRVLRLLWRGLARYLLWNGKRFLFGCCSLPGTDVAVAREAWRILHARQALHDRVLVRPRTMVSALPDDGRARPLDHGRSPDGAAHSAARWVPRARGTRVQRAGGGPGIRHDRLPRADGRRGARGIDAPVAVLMTTVVTIVAAAARLVAAFLVLVAMALAAIAVTLCPPGTLRARATRATVSTGCRALLGALGITRRHRGPAPRAGTLLVANHLSWLDIPLALASWRCTFVAKREVRRWPLIGALGDALGVIWIDRGRRRDLRRVIPLLEAALRDGRSVMLFPEGTTTEARAVLPFRSGLFEAAVRAGATVTPVALSADAASLDPAALCWHGDETLLVNLARVAALRGARITVYAGGPLADVGDRKALARRAHFETERRFRPIRLARIRQRMEGASAGVSSVLAKQNFRPIESSEREILV